MLNLSRPMFFQVKPEEASFPPMPAHQLRDTFGTEGASAGLTGSELQALMGHVDLTTTQQCTG